MTMVPLRERSIGNHKNNTTNVSSPLTTTQRNGNHPSVSLPRTQTANSRNYDDDDNNNNNNDKSPLRRRRHRRHSTSFRISKTAKEVYAVDFFVVLLLFAMTTVYLMTLHPDRDTGGGSERFPRIILPLPLNTPSMGDGSNDGGSTVGETPALVAVPDAFEAFSETAPACNPLEPHQVTFGLAIALRETELHRVPLHCRRWGLSAPISLAVYTESQTAVEPEQILQKLVSLDQTHECNPQRLVISTLSAASETEKEEYFPRNQLRNLAIRGLEEDTNNNENDNTNRDATTVTHVVYLDSDVFPSADLYDSLYAPATVRELAKDPKLAIVVPSFESAIAPSHHHHPCISQECLRQSVPGTFEGLIVGLSRHKARVFQSQTDVALQGSTLYREWVVQDHGTLVSIDCVSSEKYRPFVAVRYCQVLPPFQEVLTTTTDVGEDEDLLYSTWILHLLRVGYTFRQLGGGFVVNLPTKKTTTTHQAAAAASQGLRRTAKGASPQQDPQSFPFTRQGFLAWMDQNVPNHRSMEQCPEFEEEAAPRGDGMD